MSMFKLQTSNVGRHFDTGTGAAEGLRRFIDIVMLQKWI